MEKNKNKPVRVLHVIGKFNIGGIETWLLNIVKNLPSSNYQFDFFTISTDEAVLDNEIISLGCKIFKASNPRPSFFSIYGDLKMVTRKNGPYDAIHSHVHHFSGIILFISYLLRISVRIAHSHTDTRLKEGSSNILRKGYIKLMRSLVYFFSTRGISVSSNAAEDQFGPNWKKDKRWIVLPCGVDFSKFDIPRDTSVVSLLGIPPGFKVIGHIGRFDKPKNHIFLINVFKKILDRGNNVFCILVGDGHLKGLAEDLVRSLGISSNVRFLGIRPDRINLLCSVIDVFLFPSLYEGLPLSFIEAQLAGCYCVGSDVLHEEAVLVAKNVKLLSLKESLDVWASKVEDFLSLPEMKDSNAVLAQYRYSDYELKTNIRRLLSYYHK